VAQAITDGIPLVEIGDPVYYEPLAVAFDKGGPDPSSMVARVNEIIEAMRADGTLKAFSEKWFGTDLTTPPQ
jgi:polar amino acid transport system substrate-binding protein